MPEISRFYGIIIQIYFADHNPPHFHAIYEGQTVLVEIRTLNVLAGSIQPRALGMVMEWAVLHQEELSDLFTRAQKGESLYKIAPLA
jgi:hypothetical protein